MARKYYITGGVLIAAVLVATLAAYPHLPETVPMHWNAHGQVNGWGPKWSLFVLNPGIMAGILLISSVLPWLSPKQFEVDSFRSTYLYIMVMILALFAYIHALILCASLSWAVDVSRALMGGISLLIALLGNVMGKVRRNFFVGVRTPWTLANEQVWNATHRFAAKIFFLGGLLGLVFAVLGLPFWLSLAAILTATLAPVLYSLIFYKQLERQGEL
jgi:uncharacterized membrane protein